MINQEVLAQIREKNDAERWGEIHAQVQQRWPAVPNFELQAAGGDIEKIADVIARHSADESVDVQYELHQIVAEADGLVGQIKQTATRAREAIEEGVSSAPGTTMTLALGVGLIAGTLLGCMLAPAPKPPTAWERVRPWS